MILLTNDSPRDIYCIIQMSKPHGIPANMLGCVIKSEIESSFFRKVWTTKKNPSVTARYLQDDLMKVDTSAALTHVPSPRHIPGLTIRNLKKGLEYAGRNLEKNTDF
ncbi:hypothetical protein GOODEAATRI_004047 [Goodea atripinnis]|uniref:Uncharacterized protein n=1 Tax=Goodea atripinnis TaxID=208336 RepID=A0ABV0MYI7_9TELE